MRILIELLSPLRAGAMTRPDELECLLDELQAQDVFAAALDPCPAVVCVEHHGTVTPDQLEALVRRLR